MRRLCLAAATAVALIGIAPDVHAQPGPPSAAATGPMSSAERRQVIDALAQTLESNYVFPDVGARYAAMLRAHLASGAYDRLTDPTAFASAVTADLQSVAKDGHLRLALQSSFARRAPAPADAPLSTRASGPPGLEEARMIGDVAYLRFNEFPEEPGTAQAARRFLISHADAKAVIIDSRPNRGGGLGVMDAILPLLYAKKTHLLRMDTRASADAEGPLKGWPTLVRQSSPPSVVSRDHLVTPDRTETRLQRTPVYYLTSGRTASAAEHLALAFKRTHRAILIGETTRGADHFGGLVPIGERFAAFVPVGRTYNPQTGWDWEGRGVAPDIAAPADDALAVALKQAKAAAARPPGR